MVRRLFIKNENNNKTITQEYQDLNGKDGINLDTNQSNPTIKPSNPIQGAICHK
jgi:hypothetical protein